jgi:hypothetical protein
MQIYKIDFFHIGLYKAENAKICQNELICHVKKKTLFSQPKFEKNKT